MMYQTLMQNGLILIIISASLASSSAEAQHENVHKLNFLDDTVNEFSYPNLWKLDMSNHTKYQLPAATPFLVHQRLSAYLCNRCSIQRIYRESFSRVPYLQSLELDDNSLSYIHPSAFEDNLRLRELSLRYNQLVTFNPEAALNHVDGLLSLDMSGNAEFDFSHVNWKVNHLKRFRCHGCNVSKLDKKSLGKMPWITKLELQSNLLEYVDENTFDELMRIEYIDFSHNPMLKKLQLKSDKLKTIIAKSCSLEGTFDTSHLPALMHLNVRNNTISALNEWGFQRNQHLKSIVLDDNEIEQFPKKLLSIPLIHLSRICLDQNPLQPWGNAYEAKQLYRVRMLRINCLDDANPLKQFETYLPELDGRAIYQKSKTDFCSENSCKFISYDVVFIEQDYFTKLNNITELDMVDNSKFDLPFNQVFIRSKFIERLSLINSSITNIYDQSFQELPNLLHLNLKRNKLRSLIIPSIFQGNPKLVYINLAHNQIHNIMPDFFRELQNLTLLTLDHNTALRSLDHNVPFLESSSLRELSCRHCGFHRIDNRTFISLPSLEQLDLHGNIISTLYHDAFRFNKNLERVNLQRNHLITFAPELNSLPKLQSLCLSGNRDFDLQHPNSKHLAENVGEVARLEANCSEKSFSAQLVRYTNMAQFDTIIRDPRTAFSIESRKSRLSNDQPMFAGFQMHSSFSRVLPIAVGNLIVISFSVYKA